ncbi:MAG TPA: type VI secretion IcmF C-terminal domain-containing protein, partial [Azonexus sp.]|nr:type VI secretion IcmF C-terminal domain-containing protein [Azonexus sp.]
RPLLQTYAAIIRPASEELNKTWVAQVQEPFSRKLAIKYPFSPQAGIEAGPAEIAQIFGPEGAVAKFAESALGGLVERRGNTITPRTWGDLGLALQADFMNGFSRWVAPLEGGVAADNQGASQAQTVFMLRPQPAAGTIAYVVEVDGQKLNYRNGASQWANFIWPNPAGTPGARIMATTFDGETIDIINFPGRFGLEKMINSAARTRQPDGSFRLKWANRGVEVSIDLRLLSSPQAQSGRSNDGGGERSWNGMSLPLAIAQVEPAAAPVASEPAATSPAAPPPTSPAPATAGGAQ